MPSGYVDGDGHIMENDEVLTEYLEEPFAGRRSRVLLPSFDRFHQPSVSPQGVAGPRHEGTFDRTMGPERWLEFLDKTGIEYTVLYPTSGLAFGQVVFPDWAIAYARAYNNFLHETYLTRSPRLRGMALIPMQDVPSAVSELKRAVTELGFLGAMIPSNGLARHLSAREYWPVYEEAARLNCSLAIHGGCYGGLGFDSFTQFPSARALGMPFPLAIAMTGLIVDGVFDAFPSLRVAFLEGGTAWIPLVIDRLEREREYGGLIIPRPVEDYFRSGCFYVGCEGNERALSYAIQRVGPDPFMFCSDFPHEITLENCMEEIDEIRERDDISEEHKTAILGDNARRFYGSA